MFNQTNNHAKRGFLMELLLPIGIVAVWLLLQIWILPRFGIQT